MTDNPDNKSISDSVLDDILGPEHETEGVDKVNVKGIDDKIDQRSNSLDKDNTSDIIRIITDIKNALTSKWRFRSRDLTAILSALAVVFAAGTIYTAVQTNNAAIATFNIQKDIGLPRIACHFLSVAKEFVFDNSRSLGEVLYDVSPIISGYIKNNTIKYNIEATSSNEIFTINTNIKKKVTEIKKFEYLKKIIAHAAPALILKFPNKFNNIKCTTISHSDVINKYLKCAISSAYLSVWMRKHSVTGNINSSWQKVAEFPLNNWLQISHDRNTDKNITWQRGSYGIYLKLNIGSKTTGWNEIKMPDRIGQYDFRLITYYLAKETKSNTSRVKNTEDIK